MDNWQLKAVTVVQLERLKINGCVLFTTIQQMSTLQLSTETTTNTNPNASTNRNPNANPTLTIMTQDTPITQDETPI